jgi:aryl-alcohol dehydrogenase-like predicted oxidoreductase
LTAYAALLRAGKIRAIGTSNCTAPRLARALQLNSTEQLPRYQTLQPKYNLCERTEFEGALAALCQQEQLGVICYGSLASGFLTGKYCADATLAQSKRRPEVEKFLNPRGFRIIATLLDLAARYEATPAQIALAWLLTRPGLTAPITSATSVDQLMGLLAATRLHLDPAALAQLEQASAP